ncbi:EamA family transporter RarD [Pseudomonas sp. NFXW11]|uniref:EamA family transporter RarD n=1 Tax=Pseudomonas sp. NFXW11 TaxID=2819531 RepID=UPI003CE900D6
MAKGIALSVLASVLFAVMYFYTSLLAPLGGVEIFGWRMLLTLPCMTLFMLLSGEWSRVGEVLQRVRHKPLLGLALLLSSALVGVQLWLFMWAPLNGHSLDVSLGYFLLPLTMVLTGRIVYGERLSRLQKTATALACLGVCNELYQVGSFSWATALVALGYPLYFILRRRLGSDHLGGLWIDMALLIPVALWVVQSGAQGIGVLAAQPRLYLLIPLLGLISASALVCYIIASRALPFSLFGLLSYVEPVLLLLVALMLGESIQGGQWLTYVPIWLAVLALVLEGARHLARQRRN